jgi:hypothetical protein
MHLLHEVPILRARSVLLSFSLIRAHSPSPLRTWVRSKMAIRPKVEVARF